MEQCPIIPNLKEKKWEIFEDFTYVTKSGIPIVLKKGFLTDLASVPFFFRWRYPKCRLDYATASAVHDKILDEKMPRKFADKIFKEILDVTATEHTEQVFYDAVSLWSKVKSWFN